MNEVVPVRACVCAFNGKQQLHTQGLAYSRTDAGHGEAAAGLSRPLARRSRTPLVQDTFALPCGKPLVPRRGVSRSKPASSGALWSKPASSEVDVLDLEPLQNLSAQCVGVGVRECVVANMAVRRMQQFPLGPSLATVPPPSRAAVPPQPLFRLPH